MKLYEIKQQINDILESVQASEGEIDESQEAELDSLCESKEKKVEACMKYMRNQEALIDARKVEINRLKELNTSAEKDLEKLNDYLFRCLGEGYKAALTLGKFYFKKTIRTEVTDIEKVPETYRKYKTTFTPDKAGAKKDYLAGGAVPDGFKFVEHYKATLGKGKEK